MGTKWQEIKAAYDCLIRFWLMGSLVGGVVAYAVLVTSALVWGLPDRVWWLFVLGPVVGLGLPLVAFWFASRLEIEEARRREGFASPPKRLTLRRIMGAIAGSALAFASLPWFLSIPLVVAVFGILGLDGIHPPLLTGGGGVRQWVPWAVWSLALAACPIAMAVLDSVYRHGGPPVYDRWVARVLESQPRQANRLVGVRNYRRWVARLQAIQSGTAQLRRGDRHYDYWVGRALEGLFLAHLGIMVIASVVVLTKRSYRWRAWAVILSIGVLSLLLFDSCITATAVPHY